MRHNVFVIAYYYVEQHVRELVVFSIHFCVAENNTLLDVPIQRLKNEPTT